MRQRRNEPTHSEIKALALRTNALPKSFGMNPYFAFVLCRILRFHEQAKKEKAIGIYDSLFCPSQCKNYVNIFEELDLKS